MPLLLRFYLFVLGLTGLSMAVFGRRRETLVRMGTLLVLLHVVVGTLWVGPAAFAAFAAFALALSVWEAAPGGPAARLLLTGVALLTGAAFYLRLPAAAAAVPAVLVAAATPLLPARAVGHPAFAGALSLGLAAPGAAFLARLAAPNPDPVLAGGHPTPGVTGVTGRRGASARSARTFGRWRRVGPGGARRIRPNAPPPRPAPVPRVPAPWATAACAAGARLALPPTA